MNEQLALKVLHWGLITFNIGFAFYVILYSWRRVRQLDRERKAWQKCKESMLKREERRDLRREERAKRNELRTFKNN